MLGKLCAANYLNDSPNPAKSSGLPIADSSSEPQLTSREIEVLRLVAAGNSNKRIATKLTISAETVKTHVRNILRKLGAHDRTHAAILGLRRGIIPL